MLCAFASSVTILQRSAISLSSPIWYHPTYIRSTCCHFVPRPRNCIVVALAQALDTVYYSVLRYSPGPGSAAPAKSAGSLLAQQRRARSLRRSPSPGRPTVGNESREPAARRR